VPSSSVWVTVVICYDQNNHEVGDSRDGVAKFSRLLRCYALLNGELINPLLTELNPICN
jgi:hypothetical protein